MNSWEIEAKAILGFWAKHSPDVDRGGFYGRMDGQGVLHKEASKGLVMHARILWAFSTAWHQFRDSVYLDLADRAYRYLVEHFYDPVYGGVYWAVQADGKPLATQKQTYGQSFYLYGLAAYYSINQREDVLLAAKDLFRCIEARAKDPMNGGYLEAFSRSWEEQKDEVISRGAAKSTNTHLHLMEAYTALYSIWPDFSVKVALEKLVALFEKKIYVAGRGMGQFFHKDWKKVEAPLSYGHDIETYWLLLEATAHLGVNMPALLQEEMPWRALGHLDAQGGMWNDALRREKHWWVQAEALVGFAYAYQISGENSYKKALQGVWQAIEKEFKCPDGEWYWGVDENGNVLAKEDRIGFWKCPYHHVRALLILSKMEGNMS